MEHVFWVIDGLLGGRPGPVEAPWRAEQLRAGTVQVVVSLNREADGEDLAAAGLSHHVLPQPPVLPVTGVLQDLLLHGLEEVLLRVHEEVTAGRVTMLHCHAGKDRTGLALVAHLVRYEGIEIEEAISRVRAVRPIAMSAPGYEETARRFAELDRVRRKMAVDA